MKIIIIEDEVFAAEALEKIILDLRPSTKILAVLGSVEDAIEWFQNHKLPDLIFCDIHLSDGSSFGIFKQVDVLCPIIFTTAFNQYAIEAFQVNSVDYLLKPLKKEDVAKSVAKYEDIKLHQLHQEFENLKNLLSNNLGSSDKAIETKSRFMVRSGQSLIAIASEEVAYFLAEEGLVFLVNHSGKRYVVNYTLDQLEGQLATNIFFRANRQLIVNIKAISEVRQYFKGRLLLLVKPELKSQMVISSNKVLSFKEWMDL